MRIGYARSVVLTVLAACSMDASGSQDFPLDASPTVDVSAWDVGTDFMVDAAATIDMAPGDATASIDSDGADVSDVGPLEMYGTSVVGGRLVLTTDLTAEVDDCMPSEVCDDVDGDGLSDAWEQLILESYRPIIVFDETETLLGDPDAVVLHVGRVVPVGRRPLVAQMYLTILYDRDYGSCGSFSSHNGDSERVVVTVSETPTGVQMDRVYTAAHEGTITDASMRFLTADLGELEYDDTVIGEARWVAYSSEDKHATYATKLICESTSRLPCVVESCGPTFSPGVETSRLLDVYNAGEPDAPMIDDLTAIGFPGEFAWVDQDFCGGLTRGSGCPGSVRGKLTTDPF